MFLHTLALNRLDQQQGNVTCKHVNGWSKVWKLRILWCSSVRFCKWNLATVMSNRSFPLQQGSGAGEGCLWNSTLFCLHIFYLKSWYLCMAGDQSDLHIIIFDEIDAICKVCSTSNCNARLLVSVSPLKAFEQWWNCSRTANSSLP